jgi:trigger factor
MQVTIETTTGLERRLTVGVPAEKVDRQVEQKLQKAATQVKLDGFRPGKVPMKVLRQRFGAGVRQEVLGDVINQSFMEAVVQEKLEPAGQPRIETKENTPGRDLQYTATFEVYPEVALAELSGVKVETPTAAVTSEDVDKMIELFRNQQGSWQDVERAAADGDQLMIDFAGTKDGEEFEGGSAEDSELVLGSKRMIPGFEDGLIGAKAGDEKVLALTFPEDYHSEDLKGAAVEFKVTVKSVAERVQAEMNEEFFEKYGVSGDEATFLEEVQSNMERELKNATRRTVKQRVMDQLLEMHEVQLPEALVAAEVDALRRQAMQQFGNLPEGLDVNSILPAEMFKEQAEKRASLGLILKEVVKAESVKADLASIRSEIEEIASTYEEPEEVVNYYYGNQELLQSVENMVIENQVIDAILAKADVSEVEQNYEDIIAAAQAAGQGQGF